MGTLTILTLIENTVQYLKYGIQLCPGGKQVCRELSGNLRVSLLDERGISRINKPQPDLLTSSDPSGYTWTAWVSR